MAGKRGAVEARLVRGSIRTRNLALNLTNQKNPIDAINCLVAERHWDQVGWAIAEYAWRFQPVIDEVR